MDWSNLFSRLAADPAGAWGEGQQLQARKLAARLDARMRATGHGPSGAVGEIVDAARRRAAPPALFLVNCGSSGSHWIEAMLAALPGIHACGEVYVPPSMHEPLAALDDTSRGCFIDALHLLHAEDPGRVVEADDLLVNSAHSWNPHDLAGSAARAVLLVRDPVDVVLSRTFRKPKLRRHVATDASDAEYLARNRDFVARFMASALRRRPRHVVRYEQARTDPAGLVATILAAVGRPFDDAAARRVAALAGRDKPEGAGGGNRYRGPEVDVPPDVVARLAADLAPLRAQLGYAER